jgi:hypothetical protein
MGHAEQPRTEVLAGFPVLQVLNQRQKNLLDNFLAIANGQAETQQVTQKLVPEQIEKRYHFLFQRRGAANGLGCGGRRR